MHDALAYKPDTIIVDIDDWQDESPRSRRPSTPPIAIGRVDTEDLIVHVRDEHGHWHRLHPNRLDTACGLPWTNWGHQNKRSGRYPDPPLAPCDCWTKAERAESETLAGNNGQAP